MIEPPLKSGAHHIKIDRRILGEARMHAAPYGGCNRLSMWRPTLAVAQRGTSIGGRVEKVAGARGVLGEASVGPGNGQSDPMTGSSRWHLAAVGANPAVWLWRRPRLSDWLVDSTPSRWHGPAAEAPDAEQSDDLERGAGRGARRDAS